MIEKKDIQDLAQVVYDRLNDDPNMLTVVLTPEEREALLSALEVALGY